MTDHVVHKISLHLPVSAYDQAVSIQAEAKHWMTHSFPALIGTELDELAGEDEIIYLDTLTIELDDFPWKISEQRWRQTLNAMLSANMGRQPALSLIFSQWLFYLRWGSFERIALLKSVREMEVYFLQQADKLHSPELQSLFFNQLSSTVFHRLFNNHSKEFIAFWFSVVFRISVSEGEKIRQHAASHLFVSPDSVLHMLNLFVRESRHTGMNRYQELLTLWRADADFQVLPGNRESNLQRQHSTDARESYTLQEVFIECSHAGIVILFPYVKRFLQNIRLVVDDHFIDEEGPVSAIQALYFLTTGKTSGEENEYVLMKILCGLHLETHVHFDGTLPQQVVDEADELLRSVIGHWDKLQHTSIEGFRETFLQRTGKFCMKEDHILLQVAESGVDILLNTIPWGFRNYKLPWMQQPVITEWY